MQIREERKKSSFSKAFWVVNPQELWALETLYAYCRCVDDIVDEEKNASAAADMLDAWESFLLKKQPPQTKLQHELNELFLYYPNLKVSDLIWVLNGMRMDLNTPRYADPEELRTYCDAVAGAVGLCILVIMGLDRDQHYEFALHTGRALQLTNIIRDLKEDAARDRIYIPKSVLLDSGCSEKDVILGQVEAAAFEKMMIRMDKWAREEYEKSKEYKFEHSEDRVKSLPAQIMRKAYAMLLDKMTRSGYKVFAQKVKLNLFEKGYLMLWSALHFVMYKLKRT